MGIEWYKDRKGEFRFRVKAANGKIVGHGESYTRKENMMKGIRSLMINLEIAFKEGDIVKVKG